MWQDYKEFIFLDFFQTQEVENLKLLFIRFVSYITGKPVFYNLNTLKDRHRNMGLKNQHFDLFKSYFLVRNMFIPINQKSFLSIVQTQKLLLFEFSSKIESFRYMILNKQKVFADVYNSQLNGFCNNNSLQLLEMCQLLYQRIFSDLIISPFFQGFEVESQAARFSKILTRLMSFNTKDYGYNMGILRFRHKGYHLNNVHFVIFKQHMITTLRQSNVKEKELYLIATRTDGFKACITNKDSLKDLATQAKGGQGKVIQQYFKLLLSQKSLANFVAVFGKQFLYDHCSYIFHYFMNQHNQSVLDSDLLYLHGKKYQFKKKESAGASSIPTQLQLRDNYRILEIEIDIFSEGFMLILENLKMDQNNLIDFQEKWQTIKMLTLNQTPIGYKIGKRPLDVIYSIQFSGICCNLLRESVKQQEHFQIFYKSRISGFESYISGDFNFVLQSQILYLLGFKNYSPAIGYIRDEILFLEISFQSYEAFTNQIIQVLSQMSISENYLKKCQEIVLSYKDCIASFQPEDQPIF